ncbi:MAG: tyrosine recombinase XerC [Bryobacteraceae bacterium]
MAAKKPKARADGEGSIFSREGKWIAQVTFIAPDGSRKVVRRVTATQGDARKKLTELKGDQDAHRLVVTNKATVRNWLDVWLEEFIRPKRAPRTYANYHDVLEQHLPDRLDRMALTKLATEDLQRQFNVVAAEHPRTADLLRAVLRSAFNKAVKLGRMKNNPVLATDPVLHHQTESATFTAEQALRFLDAAKDDRLGALFTVALSLGLRKGEGTGLKPEDVDLDQRVVHVRRSLQWVKLPDEKEGRWIERPPKRNSYRDLPMTETVYRAIVHHITRREQEAAATKGWKDSGYLFTSVTGAPLHERNVSEAFHALCDRAKVPRIRFHDTRHSCGTLLNAQGASPFTIQRVLGHSQLSTTKRYTHVPIEVTKAALEGVESLVEAARKKADEQKTVEAEKTEQTPVRVQ